MDQFLGQGTIFGGNFAVREWALCDGQLLPINSNSALFSLLGTIYGGDGRTTFALPDLRGRFNIQWGSGAGLTPRAIGQAGGAETHTLTLMEIPSHNHVVYPRYTNTGTTSVPANAYPAPAAGPSYGVSVGGNMGAADVSNTGGGMAHENTQPFLCVTHLIALQGVFPSRN